MKMKKFLAALMAGAALTISAWAPSAEAADAREALAADLAAIEDARSGAFTTLLAIDTPMGAATFRGDALFGTEPYFTGMGDGQVTVTPAGLPEMSFSRKGYIRESEYGVTTYYETESGEWEKFTRPRDEHDEAIDAGLAEVGDSLTSYLKSAELGEKAGSLQTYNVVFDGEKVAEAIKPYLGADEKAETAKAKKASKDSKAAHEEYLKTLSDEDLARALDAMGDPACTIVIDQDKHVVRSVEADLTAPVRSILLAELPYQGLTAEQQKSHRELIEQSTVKILFTADRQNEIQDVTVPAEIIASAKEVHPEDEIDPEFSVSTIN